MIRQSDRQYYSTRELAKLLQVNGSTIRRWADTGKLKCFKSPGGHRKYTPRHVSEFISRYAYELLSFDFDFPPTVLEEILTHLLMEKDYHGVSEMYSVQAIRADKESLINLMRICQLAGLSSIDILDDIVREAARTLLSYRRQEKITAAQEQIASNAIVGSLLRLRSMTMKNLSNEKVAICGSFSEGVPDVILCGACHLLEDAGWRVFDLGSKVLIGRFLDLIEKHSPKLICISYDHDVLEGELPPEAGAIIDAAKRIKATVLLPSFEAPNGLSTTDSPTKLMTFSNYREMLSLVKQIGS